MKEEAVSMAQNDAILEILLVVKKLARRYRVLTGKPLGVTGEVAEYDAARLLELELTIARQAWYDAILSQDGKITRYQIKGRCVRLSNSSSRILQFHGSKMMPTGDTSVVVVAVAGG
jgi:hypothetical protein